MKTRLKKACAFFGFIFILSLAFAVCSGAEDTCNVSFSVPAGFYTEEFSLKLSTDIPNGQIYYTTDGTDPRTSQSAVLYNGAIKIVDGYTGALFYNEDLTSLTSRINGSDAPIRPMLRANAVRAYAKNAVQQTTVFTNTYFVNKDIKNVFGGLCVVNLNVDKKDDFIGIDGLYYNGNLQKRGKEWRKAAVCEIFEPDGMRTVNQYVTLSLNGHGSLAANQKSIRFHATDNVPGHPELLDTSPKMIEADLFAGDAEDTDGQVIDKFKCILMRNGGNDASVTMLRDAFTHRIAKNTNISVQAYRPAMLYVNGEFWGLYNMRERYDDKYVQTHFGVKNENAVLISCPYPLNNPYSPTYEVDEGNPSDIDDFYEVYDFVLGQDMTTDENLAFVKERFDTDSLIDYMCIEMFSRNADWPNNNVKLWRNKNPLDPSGMDTRWRMMLNDTDMGFYFDGRGYNDNMMIQTLVNNSNTTIVRLFNGLLVNETFKSEFIDRFLYLLDNDFSADVTVPMFDEMISGIEPVVDLAFARWPGDRGSHTKWETELLRVREFAQKRPDAMRRHLLQYFGMSDGNVVTCINDPSCGTLYINGTASTDYSRSIRNLVGKNVTFTVMPKEGVSYAGFSVVWADGKQEFIGTNTLSYDEMRGASIVCVYEKAVGAQMHIAAGYDGAFMLSDSGVLSFFGKNAYGQAGFESGDLIYPVPVGCRVTAASHGGSHSLLVTDDGTAFSAGDFSNGRLARDDEAQILKKVNLEGITAVSAGFDHSLFLTKNGTLYGTGNNSYHQVSPQSAVSVLRPYPMAQNVRDMSAGRRHSLYITNDNKLYFVGDSRFGKAGINNLGIETSVQPVFVMENVSRCFAVFHNSFAVKENGDLYGWGWNSGGSLGVGNTDYQASPIFVMKNVKQVAGYDAFTLILTNDGKLYGTGRNLHGQMGNMKDATIPTFICENVLEIAAGNGFSIIYKKDGTVQTMGSATAGKMGTTNLVKPYESLLPVTVTEPELDGETARITTHNNSDTEAEITLLVAEYTGTHLDAVRSKTIKVPSGESGEIVLSARKDAFCRVYRKTNGLQKIKTGE